MEINKVYNYTFSSDPKTLYVHSVTKLSKSTMKRQLFKEQSQC